MWFTYVFANAKNQVPLATYEYKSQAEMYSDALRVARTHPGMFWEMKPKGGLK